MQVKGIIGFVGTKIVVSLLFVDLLVRTILAVYNLAVGVVIAVFSFVVADVCDKLIVTGLQIYGCFLQNFKCAFMADSTECVFGFGCVEYFLRLLVKCLR